MALLLFANNAFALTVNDIQPSDTSVNITPGAGTSFPNISAPGLVFLATLSNPALPPTVFEIVLVTARSGDVMTMTRAQENTTAQVWLAGSQFQLLLTAGGMTSFQQPAQVQSQSYNYGVDSGLINAYVVALNPVLTAPVNGLPIRVLIGAGRTNTGPATLNADGTARPIKTKAGAALSGGEIVANSITPFIWNPALAAYQVG